MGTKRNFGVDLTGDDPIEVMLPPFKAAHRKTSITAAVQTELHASLKRIHLPGKALLNQILTPEMRIVTIPGNGSCLPIAAGVDEEQIVQWRLTAAEQVKNGPDTDRIEDVMGGKDRRLALAAALARVDAKKGGAHLSMDAVPVLANMLGKAMAHMYFLPNTNIWIAEFAWNGVWQPLGFQQPPPGSTMTKSSRKLATKEDMLSVLNEFDVLLFDGIKHVNRLVLSAD